MEGLPRLLGVEGEGQMWMLMIQMGDQKNW